MGLIHIELFATLDLVGQAPGGPDEDPVGFPFGGWQAPLLDDVDREDVQWPRDGSGPARRASRATSSQRMPSSDPRSHGLRNRVSSFAADVSKKDAKVCVRVAGAGRRKTVETVTTWGAMTGQILALREHLVAEQVTCVVMEATGDYWKPFYYLLEDLPVEDQQVGEDLGEGLVGRLRDQQLEAVPDDGVIVCHHDRQQFAHASDQRNFGRFTSSTQSSVKFSDFGIAPTGHQCSHIKGRTHRSPPAPNRTTASHHAAVPIQRRHTHQCLAR